jgi:exopolyphosphatase / guanosine-5'-triphosphate,3'-diphosphate pyrophosphatase
VTRVAGIDCGTNSVRLLVADVDPQADTLDDLDRRLQIVRLGQGVDRTGRLAPEALERTMRALRAYAARIDELGAQRVRMVATSATRDAENRDEFVRGVHEVLGVEPEVVSGGEEAALSFTGATRELVGRDDVISPYLAVDIGGGSTEFVLGTREAALDGPPGDGALAARSVDVGCVRMTERHFHDDPPTTEQVRAARRDVERALDLATETVPLAKAGTLVGLAGTVTTVAGIALGHERYDATLLHHARLSAEAVRRTAGRLLAMTHDERAALPVMHPGRVDVIAAGALVLDAVVARADVNDLLVSEHDILDGICWSLA